MEAKKLTAIRLEPRLFDILKQTAEKNGVPYGEIINHGIRQALQEIKAKGRIDWKTISLGELV